MTGSGFARREAEGIVFYTCLALDDLAFVRHGFSTRFGGVSPLPSNALNLSRVSWDSPANVAENRRRFARALRMETSPLVTLAQIHSDRVHIIEESPAFWNSRPEADALITRLAGVALSVQVADCLPILIADPEGRVIAAVHAGWRGSLARIVAKTIARLEEDFRCDPGRLLIAIGPGIRACCFEVGKEVVDAFALEYHGARIAEPRPAESTSRDRSPAVPKFMLDLRKALDIQLREARISPSLVFDLQACTCCKTDEFFSYRAEGDRSGRMMGVIARVET